MSIIMEGKNISKTFKGVSAVTDYSLKLESGSIFGLIGTNGAGKTTVFNMLTGLIQPTSGEIIFNGTNIIGQRSDKIARLGVSRTFQNLRLFGKSTVLENTVVGAQINKTYNMFETIFMTPKFLKEEKTFQEEAIHILDVLGLSDFLGNQAGSLPYGSQRKLEIARALATHPKLLLLDEPAAGMNPKESQDLMRTIQQIRQQFDLTILIIEHDMQVIMNLCDKIQVLCYGKIIAEGLPKEIANNPEVIVAYLGRNAKNA